MLKIVATENFERDIEIQKQRGMDLERLKPIIEDLANQKPLPYACCDNPIPYTWGRWNCRVGFDWWLIYKVDTKAGKIFLERTGSVKALFE